MIYKRLLEITRNYLLLYVLGNLCRARTEHQRDLNIQLSKPVFLQAKRDVLNDTWFGTSLALAGNAVFVGAPKYSYGGGIFRCNATDGQCSNVKGFPNHGSLKYLLFLNIIYIYIYI